MASESQGDGRVGADVPAELHEWLDERAASLGIERKELVVQILASYHATATLDGELDAAALLDLDADDFVDVERAVDEAASDVVSDRVDTAVDDRIDEALERRLDDLIGEVGDDVAERVRTAIESERRADLGTLESDFQAKIRDVRERVVQVKREADGKSPADHTHGEFDAIHAIDERLDGVASDLATLRNDVDERLDEREADAEAFGSRIDDAENKLNRVAWVVSDLKDETTGRDAHERAVERIKRAAAQENVATAECERCGDSVRVALLTDPECPHCSAAVSDVRPAGGFFRKKARLVPAAQLESGEERDDV